MLIIEIIKNHEAVLSVEKRDKSGVMYSQKGYMHTQGAFPVEINIPLSDHNDKYPVGQYTLDSSSFKVNQYGQLEVNRWEMKLKPIAQANLQKVG